MSQIDNHPTALENELFLDNMEKEANFINFKINISDLKKIINEKIQMELKTFKIESAKHLSESLTHSTDNLLKEECKAKEKISAKHSRMIEKFKKYKGPSNITGCSNKLKSTCQRASSLGHNASRIQEEVPESSHTKQSK